MGKECRGQDKGSGFRVRGSGFGVRGSGFRSCKNPSVLFVPSFCRHRPRRSVASRAVAWQAARWRGKPRGGVASRAVAWQAARWRGRPRGGVASRAVGCSGFLEGRLPRRPLFHSVERFGPIFPQCGKISSKLFHCVEKSQKVYPAYAGFFHGVENHTKRRQHIG